MLSADQRLPTWEGASCCASEGRGRLDSERQPEKFDNHLVTRELATCSTQAAAQFELKHRL
jgi:hypothetical protein